MYLSPYYTPKVLLILSKTQEKAGRRDLQTDFFCVILCSNPRDRQEDADFYIIILES